MSNRVKTAATLYLLTVLATIGVRAPSVHSQPPSPTSGDAEAILGIWEVVALEAGGRPESDKNYRWTTFVFSRDKLILREGFNPPLEFTYHLDPSTTPKAIDLTIRGHTARGIYKLEGDELLLCISMGGPRPTNFTTRGRNDTEMFTLRRSLWERYTEPNFGFVIEAPGQWQTKTVTIDLPAGPAPLFLYQTAAIKERLIFTLGVVPLQARPSGKALEAIFEAAQHFLEKQMGDQLVAEEAKVKAPGPWAARELTLRPPEGNQPFLRGRLYLIGDRLFILAVSGPEENVRTAAFRFWATFRPPPSDPRKSEPVPRKEPPPHKP